MLQNLSIDSLTFIFITDADSANHLSAITGLVTFSFSLQPNIKRTYLVRGLKADDLLFRGVRQGNFNNRFQK